MRLAIRVFVDGVKIIEDKCVTTALDLPDVLADAAARHIEEIERRGENFTVEVEFLDEQGAGRFFRFGTDPRGMTMPLPLSLDKPN